MAVVGAKSVVIQCVEYGLEPGVSTSESPGQRRYTLRVRSSRLQFILTLATCQSDVPPLGTCGARMDLH